MTPSTEPGRPVLTMASRATAPRTAGVRTLAVGTIGVAAAAASCGVGLLFWTVGHPRIELVASGAPARVDELLVVVLRAVGLAVTAWLGVGIVLSLLASLPGLAGEAAASLARRLAPAAVRRGAVLVVGAVLASTALPTAHAADPAPATTISATSAAGTEAPVPDPAFTVTTPRASTGSALVDPGFTPTGASTGTPTQPAPSTPSPAPPAAQATTAPPAAPAAPPRHSSPPATSSPSPHPSSLGPLAASARPVQATHTGVTVVRGDSLWALAARHLGPGATLAQIAREWPRWYAANRSLIGADPDLILVGQVLTAPAPDSNGAHS